MPLYEFQAMDAQGKLVRDLAEHPSVAALHEALSRKGYTLIECRKRLFDPVKLLPGRGVGRLEIAEFFRNLALLLKGGVPLRDGLEDLVESASDLRFQRIIKEMISSLEDGQMLSAAMKPHLRLFGRIPVVLAAIGEETGRLDATLVAAAEHLERIDAIIANTKRALTYPAFVVVCMAAALGFWMMFVLPKVLSLFENMGLTDLPFATRVLMAAVDLFNTYWPIGPLLIAFLVVVRIVASKRPGVKYVWDQAVTRLPLIGRVIKSAQLAFFFEYLSLLITSGIDIVRSLDLMSESVTHQVLKEGIVRMKEEIMNGSDLTSAFGNLPMAEPFVVRMVNVGEQTGQLPQQLDTLAGYYRSQVDKMVDALGKTLEPMMIVVAGLIFALIAMGLLGPIYDLMGRIEG